MASTPTKTKRLDNQDRTDLLKAISFAIGCAGTVKPEILAVEALKVVEALYELKKGLYG